MVADSSTEAREYLIGLLQMEADFYVKGDARDGQEAVDLVRSLAPDLVLIDRNLSGKDIYTVAETIAVNYPGTGIIVIFSDLDPREVRALTTYMDSFLVKPVTREDLAAEVRKVNDSIQKKKTARGGGEGGPQKSQIITVYSASGGSGKSMLACNLAVALMMESKQKTCLVDLNLQFGDIDLMLNLTPENTIVGLAQKQHSGELEADVVEHYLTEHEESGLKVLVAPATPEHSETITLYTVSQTLEALQQSYQYIIVDTPPALQDTTFAALDVSTSILVITTLDLLALHKAKTAMERLRQLYPGDKIKLVLNRANSQVGITHEQVEAHLETRISAFIPSDGHVVVRSVNEGRPFVLSDPTSPIAHRLNALAYEVMGREPPSSAQVGGESGGAGGGDNFMQKLAGMFSGGAKK